MSRQIKARLIIFSLKIFFIVDINMPQMDGITFIKKFRENDKFTPVIVLTTEAEEEKIQEGKNAGASGWVIKPFKAEQLQSVVKKFLR